MYPFRHFYSGLVSILVLLFVLTGQSQADSYRLGPSDEISIVVFGEDDLTMDIRISEAGTISYPFLGEVSVKGQTVQWIKNYITKELKGDYLIDPRVVVSIRDYRKFYVNGEVKAPGGYSFIPGMTVRKAVSLAGGFTERADRGKIFVIREGRPTEDQDKISVDERVNPGDILTVEESFF